MRVIPAVDILDGRTVRLEQGRPERELKISGSPLEVARMWQSEGADLIHVVDIGCALYKSSSESSVRTIVQELNAHIQVAGGIRSVSLAEKWLELGAYRVVLGTLAVHSPDAVTALLDSYGEDRVAVALDYDGLTLCTHGWTRRSDRALEDYLESMMAAGIRVFIATAVKRDGMLCGPDIATLTRILDFGVDRLIASGGVGSLTDLKRLRNLGLEGVIIGRALYEKRFSFVEACQAVSGGV